MSAPVAITGLGIVSPLGHSVAALARRLAAGEVAATAGDGGVYVDEIPLDVLPEGTRARVGRLDRLCKLLLVATHLAVDDARLDLAACDAERVGLSFGTGLGCLLSNAEFYEKVVAQGAAAASPRVFAYTVSSAAAGEVSIALGVHGPNVTTHGGLAAGVAALGYGVDLIRSGRADVVLAGGADANGSVLTEALRAMQLLKSAAASRPFRDAVPGMWPSEAAVVAVLERADRVSDRGGRARLLVEGHASGFEPTLASASPRGDGIAAVLRRALAASPRRPEEIAAVLASAHGTPLDAAEREALQAVVGDRPVIAAKAALGETLAAAGLLGICVAAGLYAGIQSGDHLALGLDGTPRPAPPTGPMLVSELCYSGPVTAMLIAPRHREGEASAEPR